MSEPADLAAQLERLALLRAAGALTEEEFATEKARVPSTAAADAPAADAASFSASASAGGPVAAAPYPVTYDVAYPPRLSRWKTLLRAPLMVPAVLFLWAVQAALFSVLIPLGWTTVFWRKKYPVWLFTATGGALAYIARFQAYALLQTDRYPSLDVESSPVRLIFADPPQGQLSRWRVVFWKLILLVPHFIILGALQFALSVVTVIAWFGILLTASYPRGLFAFATGVMRWHYRVAAYFASMNDRYPPYALSAGAAPGGTRSVVWSGVGGALLMAGLVAAITAAAIAGNTPEKRPVQYSALLQGQSADAVTYDRAGGRVVVSLSRAYDPGDQLLQLLKPDAGEKVVVFEWLIRNAGDSSISVPADVAELQYFDGEFRRQGPELVAIGNGSAPRSIASGSTATVRAAFVVPAGATPRSLNFQAAFTGLGGISYEFR